MPITNPAITVTVNIESPVAGSIGKLMIMPEFSLKKENWIRKLLFIH